MKLSAALVAMLFFGPCSGGLHDDGGAPSASPKVAPPSVPSASYACTHDTWVGAMPNRTRQSTPVGSITLVDGATYRWLDNGGSGHYRIDEKGTIAWLDGPIADKKPKKSTYRKNVKTSQIDVVFADGFDWSCAKNL
jgi:hypothetical protein